jgi:hypothetical protein
MPSHENLTPKGTRRDIVNEENINISLIDGSPLDSKTKEGVKDEEHNEEIQGIAQNKMTYLHEFTFPNEKYSQEKDEEPAE